MQNRGWIKCMPSPNNARRTKSISPTEPTIIESILLFRATASVPKALYYLRITVIEIEIVRFELSGRSESSVQFFD